MTHFENSGARAIELACRLLNIKANIPDLIHSRGLNQTSLTPSDLVSVLRDAKFKAGLRRPSPSKLFSRKRFPFIIRFKSGAFGLVLQAVQKEDSENLLVCDLSGNQQPNLMGMTEFQDLCEDQVIFFTHRDGGTGLNFGLGWFLAELKHYKAILFEVLASATVVQLFGIAVPLLTQVVIDKVLSSGSTSTLKVIVVAFLAICTFEWALNICRNYVFSHTCRKIDVRLGSALYRHLLRLPLAFFESRKVGNLSARIQELDRIREFLTQKSMSAILDTSFSMLFLVAMLAYSLTLTGIALGFLLSMVLLLALVTPVYRKRLNKYFQAGAENQAYLVETLTGAQTVKSGAMEGQVLKKWEVLLAEYNSAGFRLATLNQTSSATLGWLQRLLSVAVLYMGINIVLAGRLSLGELIAFQMFANQMTGSVLRMMGLWPELQQNLLAVDRLGEILNSPTEGDPASGATIGDLKGNIGFEEATFAYPGSKRDVLQSLNLSIAAGTLVALMGKSGSGKSTLSKLVQGLYHPQQGSVTVDGVDVRQLNPVWLRRNIGTVLQDNFLFSGSIADNIGLGSPGASMERIISVSKSSGAHDFISKMEKGYDTLIGERGSNLSGGQRQRIAIARALVKNPKILIFDEATSALDPESERYLHSTIQRIRENRTILFITHRPAILKICDRIVVFSEGTIMEDRLVREESDGRRKVPVE